MFWTQISFLARYPSLHSLKYALSWLQMLIIWFHSIMWTMVFLLSIVPPSINCVRWINFDQKRLVATLRWVTGGPNAMKGSIRISKTEKKSLLIYWKWIMLGREHYFQLNIQMVQALFWSVVFYINHILQDYSILVIAPMPNMQFWWIRINRLHESTGNSQMNTITAK